MPKTNERSANAVGQRQQRIKEQLAPGWGRVISWSSAGTCGFKGRRRGTPFAAQTAAGNAIRA